MSADHGREQRRQGSENKQIVITSVLRNIFRVNLGVNKAENCLIFTDRPPPFEDLDPPETERRPRLKCVAFLASEVGKGFLKEVFVQESPATGSHGAEPPQEVWETAFGTR